MADLPQGMWTTIDPPPHAGEAPLALRNDSAPAPGKYALQSSHEPMPAPLRRVKVSRRQNGEISTLKFTVYEWHIPALNVASDWFLDDVWAYLVGHGHTPEQVR
jgi:hypothetical protein